LGTMCPAAQTPSGTRGPASCQNTVGDQQAAETPLGTNASKRKC
jgi:hypothetical protein